MLRAATLIAIGLVLAGAFAFYSVNYDTRKLEARVQSQERAVEKLGNEIVVLRAERSYLARPERIERFARPLGIEPARGQQYVRSDGQQPAPLAEGAQAEAGPRPTPGP